MFAHLSGHRQTRLSGRRNVGDWSCDAKCRLATIDPTSDVRFIRLERKRCAQYGRSADRFWLPKADRVSKLATAVANSSGDPELVDRLTMYLMERELVPVATLESDPFVAHGEDPQPRKPNGSRHSRGDVTPPPAGAAVTRSGAPATHGFGPSPGARPAGAAVSVKRPGSRDPRLTRRFDRERHLHPSRLGITRSGSCPRWSSSAVDLGADPVGEEGEMLGIRQDEFAQMRGDAAVVVAPPDQRQRRG